MTNVSAATVKSVAIVTTATDFTLVFCCVVYFSCCCVLFRPIAIDAAAVTAIVLLIATVTVKDEAS